MKTISSLALAAVLAIAVCAADAPQPAAPAAGKDPAVVVTLTAAEAKITAPFVLKDGAISQPSQTEVAGGGKAVFIFKVATAGNYEVLGVVNAPDEDTNSFYLNIDAPPDDTQIWDLEVTKGFEERTGNWRGNGDSGNDEFNPKIFKLTAGEHQLIIVGREPSFLKSITIRPAK